MKDIDVRSLEQKAELVLGMDTTPQRVEKLVGDWQESGIADRPELIAARLDEVARDEYVQDFIRQRRLAYEQREAAREAQRKALRIKVAEKIRQLHGSNLMARRELLCPICHAPSIETTEPRLKHMENGAKIYPSHFCVRGHQMTSLEVQQFCAAEKTRARILDGQTDRCPSRGQSRKGPQGEWGTY